jgi:hypothetical protein
MNLLDYYLGAGAVASGAGAGAAASSFLPQADKETAKRAASRMEYFIYVPSLKMMTSNNSKSA